MPRYAVPRIPTVCNSTLRRRVLSRRLTMLPKQILAVSKNHVVPGQGISISTIRGKSDWIVLRGTSVQTSLRVGEETQAFVVYPCESGVLALSVRLTDKRGKFLTWASFFLGIENDGHGKFYAVTDKVWVPPCGRIGQAYDSYVVVMIDNKAYHSADWIKDGGAYVSDPNLLCMYLSMNADAVDVVRAAVRQEAEKDARDQLAEIGKQLTAWGLTNCDTPILDQIAGLKKMFDAAHEALEEWRIRGKELHEPIMETLCLHNLTCYGGYSEEIVAEVKTKLDALMTFVATIDVAVDRNNFWDFRGEVHAAFHALFSTMGKNSSLIGEYINPIVHMRMKRKQKQK